MKLYYDFLQRIAWKTVPKTNQNNLFVKAGRKFPAEDLAINQIIQERLSDEHPFLLGRHGAVELRLVTNILAYQTKQNVVVDSLKFITNRIPKFWEIDESYREKLCTNAGFFPNELKELEKFTKLFYEGSKEIDLLALSTKHEHFLNSLPQNIPLTHLKSLEPWWYKKPWTQALSGKKVLIVYPYKDIIEQQYKKREMLFENKLILPQFDLKVIEPVQSIADSVKNYKSWFEALEKMKTEVENTDFDIAIIGAGAYGFPLALHAKRIGKKAIHLGGPTQLLFGIKGKRWMEWPRYLDLMNENWVFPDDKYKPKGFEKIEDGCYW